MGSLSNNASKITKHGWYYLLTLEYLNRLDFSLKRPILPAITELRGPIRHFIVTYCGMLVIIRVKAGKDAAFFWVVMLDSQWDNMKPNDCFNQSLGGSLDGYGINLTV